MGTPEEKGSKNFSVRRSLANGLSIALMGISSALGMSGCSSVEKNDSQEGNNIEIPLSDYPSSEENFILNDRRTNQEKIEIIESVAPDDYQKEVNLLSEEWKRMGKNESDLEIVASVVDGKSWVLVARSRSDGRVFVPRIGGIVQASLHLFGRLDETGDFFDLVPVAIENATVVGDGSGWHVVARVEGGGVVQWYDAAADEVRAVERAEPSPTPDPRFQNLLPETLGEVEQKNVLRWDHLEEDLAELMEKEQEIDINKYDPPEFSIGTPNYDSEALKLPSVIGLTMITGEEEKISIVSCSYLDMGNGEGFYVLGIPIRRPGSQEVGILHFAMDPELAKAYFEVIGKSQTYDDYNDVQTYYPGAAQEGGKSISRMGINLVLYRGSAEEGGVWDPLLSFDPEKMAAGNEYTMTTNFAFFGSSDPQVAQRSWEEIQKRIVPCVSVGVIY